MKAINTNRIGISVNAGGFIRQVNMNWVDSEADSRRRLLQNKGGYSVIAATARSKITRVGWTVGWISQQG